MQLQIDWNWELLLFKVSYIENLDNFESVPSIKTKFSDPQFQLNLILRLFQKVHLDFWHCIE